jgi:glycosyltransferase involved in cell wall biosynthesis
MPTVDIITPAYNAAKYLPAAIESVEAQTFGDWRILLVDDGSTDNTAEVVAPYAARLGPKLRYIKKVNAGLPAARNTAISNSDAEFLALLDADDVWLPNRLEDSLKCFENRPRVGLSYGHISRIDQDGKVLDTLDMRQPNAEGMIAPYIYMRKVQLPCPTMTFRRRCVEEVGNFDETMRATEDRDMWLRIALRYEVALADKVLAFYRVSSDSMSTNPDRMFQAQIRFVEKHYGSEGCGWLQRRIAMNYVYRQHAEALAVRSRPWDALGYSLQALGAYPLDKYALRTTASLLRRCIGLSR